MNKAPDQPHPRSFQSSDSFPPGSSSTSSNFPHQHAVPAQRLQQSFDPQSHANTDPFIINDGIQSAEQREAISILQNIPSSLDVPQSIHGNNDLPNDWPPASAFGQAPSSISDPFFHITPGDTLNQPSSDITRLSRDRISVEEQSSPAATSNKHDDWCYICEDRRSFDTCNGFRRHIREHDTRYYCMPRESVVSKEDRPTCAFCNTVYPDPRHLNTHNIPKCIGKKYTRKSGLMKHLKKNHGIEDSSELADQSEYTDRKKFFPCGFCVSCYISRNDQVNHIDFAHYRLSENINSWDPNKVIRGLLSQPGVSEHWRSALAANPHCQESLFTWNPEIVQNLQHRLEMSQEPPDVLCRVAIAESNYGGSERHHVGSMQATSLTDLGMNTSQLIQTSQHRTGMSPLPPVSEPNSITHFPQAVISTRHSQRPTFNWNAPYVSDLDIVYEDQPAPQIASKTSKSSIRATYHNANNLTQPHASSNSAESFLQRPHPASAPSLMSASGNPQAFEGQTGTPYISRLGRQSQGMPSSVTTNPHSRQVTQAHNYPTQAGIGYLHPPMPIQSAALPLSRNHPTSQSGQINSPFSSRHQSNYATQFSRQEAINDMDIDPEETQRFGHDQAHSQDQRRYR